MRAQDVTAWLGAMLTTLGQRLAREERGSQTLEFCGICAAVVTLVTAVIAAMPGISETIVTAITTMVGEVTAAGGAG